MHSIIIIIKTALDNIFWKHACNGGDDLRRLSSLIVIKSLYMYAHKKKTQREKLRKTFLT